MAKSGTHVTKLGEHGYSKRPRGSGVYTKDPNATRKACSYLSLICTRAITKSCAIDDSVSTLSTTITPILTYESLICTRAVTLNCPIDDSVTTLDTGLSC